MTTIHVVVPCTLRKSRPVPPALLLRENPELDLARRVDRWVSQLRSFPDQSLCVRELYAGEHWVEFKRLLDSPPAGVSLRGWVISAGYGLLSLDSEVVPYGATFDRRHPDSVRPEGVSWDETDWWMELSKWEGPMPGEPRTLADLSRLVSGSLMIVAASHTYLRSLVLDLVKLLEAGVGETTAIMSATLPNELKDFKRSLVPFDSRLLSHLGGSRVGLAIRTVGHALRDSQTQAVVEWRRTISRTMATCPPPFVPQRVPAEDREIIEFLARELAINPLAKHSPLLRKWRRDGRACEQARFRKLHFGVRSGVVESHGQVEPPEPLR